MEGFGTFITESSTPFTMQLFTKVSEEFGFRNVWLLDGWFNYLYGLRLAKTKKISNIVFKKFIKHFLNVVGYIFLCWVFQCKLKSMSFFTSCIGNAPLVFYFDLKISIVLLQHLSQTFTSKTLPFLIQLTLLFYKYFFPQWFHKYFFLNG